MNRVVFFISFLCACSSPLSSRTPDASSHGSDGAIPPWTITEFPMSPPSGPNAIAVGVDGNLWFTETDGNKIGRITTQGKLTEFAIPTADATPTGIAAGADGNLWFTETDGNKIGRITTTGTITEFQLSQPSGYSTSWPLAIAPERDRMWFSVVRSPVVGHIDLAGEITEQPGPVGLGVFGLVAGPDGNLWLANTGANQIDCFTPSGTFSGFPLPTPNAAPDSITVGPDGNIWFTTSSFYAATTEIGRVTTTGDFTEFPLPISSAPCAIATGPDDNIWFTEQADNKIGRMSADGAFTEYPIPTSDSGPRGIVAGPDGNVWFTESNANQIGRITL
jgi:virginiamycin B lyase